jgi:hypothetical protein
MDLAQIIKWRDDAIADGWTIEPAYKRTDGTVGEPIETASHLAKDSWVALVFSRSEKGCHISVWHRGLAVDVPEEYSVDELEHNTHICSYCKGYFAETVSIGFAGRCCKKCREKHVASVEYPGWTN